MQLFSQALCSMETHVNNNNAKCLQHLAHRLPSNLPGWIFLPCLITETAVNSSQSSICLRSTVECSPITLGEMQEKLEGIKIKYDRKEVRQV